MFSLCDRFVNTCISFCRSETSGQLCSLRTVTAQRRTLHPLNLNYHCNMPRKHRHQWHNRSSMLKLSQCDEHPVSAVWEFAWVCVYVSCFAVMFQHSFLHENLGGLLKSLKRYCAHSYFSVKMLYSLATCVQIHLAIIHSYQSTLFHLLVSSLY